jgi:hypothetical protein
MVLNATFNNISVMSWRSVFISGGPGENHRPVTSHWQTSSRNLVSCISINKYVYSLKSVQQHHGSKFLSILKYNKATIQFVFRIKYQADASLGMELFSYKQYRGKMCLQQIIRFFMLQNRFSVLATYDVQEIKMFLRRRRGRDRMVVGFRTTCAISAYHQ